MPRRQGKRQRSVGGQNGSVRATTSSSTSNEPKSMVIRIGAGEVGPSVSQLVKDVRSVMEPHTAVRLKERRSNRLRDYAAMAGPLGVSHLLLFSRSSSGNTNLRLALTPRGPTLHFRVEKYSLAKDVQKLQRHPQHGNKEHTAPPLLVMNNFLNPTNNDVTHSGVPKHLESLTTSIFQSLFPPISPQSTPLSSIRRVLLVNRELSTEQQAGPEGLYVLNLRHYAITTKRTGLPRSIRRINAAEKVLKQQSSRKSNMPNLGRLADVSDFFLDPHATASGFTTASESEADSDAGIEVLESKKRKVLNKKQMEARRLKGSDADRSGHVAVEKRSVKLVELGPRMKLRMTKVEEGLCSGKILWHEYLEKTGDEIKALEAKWEKRKEEKEERRRIQRENIDKKRGQPINTSERSKNTNDNVGNDDDDLELLDDEDDWDSEVNDGSVGISINSAKENHVAVG